MIDLTCACCGYKTAESEHDICPLCNWQWDGTNVKHPTYKGGPNGGRSLFDCQRNWLAFLETGKEDDLSQSFHRPSACEETYVKDVAWKPLVALSEEFYIDGQREYHEAVLAERHKSSGES
ncbi:MAG: hypothetical protein JNM18_06040 [Planctomycetaceae bacterium]|nr:hypothetical protein [Planctomycetaceae bacterium]